MRNKSLVHFTSRSILCASAIFLGAGCGSGNKVAAIVNGQPITIQELDDRMARLNPSYREALGNDRKRLLEEMVMENALVQEARRRGLDRDREVEKLIHEAHRQILLGRLLEVIRQSQPVKVADDQVEKFYQAHADRFVQPETYRASHILVEKEETAQKALERVKAGEPFAKVAKEISTDPTKDNGGDIGYFSKGQLIPEFEAAAMKLKPGEMSSIVKSQLGFHLILLTEYKPAGKRPLADVKDLIRRQLASQQQQSETEIFVRDLRSKAHVQFYAPFESSSGFLQKSNDLSPHSSAPPASTPPASSQR